MKRPESPARQVTLWLLRIALAAVFVYAGVVKIRDPHAFSESIASFRLLPSVLVNPAALTLPPLEIVSGVLVLLGGRLRRAGVFSLLAMLLVFLAALTLAQARGLNIDCGCFGLDKFDALSPTKNLWLAIARDVVLGLAAWFLYRSTKNHSS